MSGRTSGAELLRRADIALYHGKAQDRGTVHFWTEVIERAQSVRHRAISELTLALEQGRAFAAYQPIVRIADGKTVAVEALLRLSDGKGATMTAGEISPALLDPALSRRVTRFMIEEIVREAPGILALYGPDARIGLNIAEADLRSGDFLALVERLLSTGVLQPSNITLEVTETMLLLDENGDIRNLLTLLHERGFTIALDDFGTGFSSLTHLRDFPITKVKIDRDFISSITNDQQSRLIVQAIVQMGKSLNLRMVAEGVESETELAFLRAIGCCHAQGYMFARPQSLESLQRAVASVKRTKLARRNAA
jgi:EAL domain-containing protein (putative c-di-GMP-specific phosphodiesterase class I)